MLRVLPMVIVALAAATELPRIRTTSCYDKDVKAIQHPQCNPNPPVNMCASCPLDTSNLWEEPHHGFKDCKKVYDLDHPGCKEALETYVQQTECDTSTAEAWALYYETDKENSWARQVLDRLVYNLCEFCCDCIPCGLSLDMTQESLVEQGLDLMDPGRRNCGVHVLTDNCEMFPGFTVPLDGKDIDICPMVDTWRHAHKLGLSKLERVKLEEELRPLLQKMTEMYGCAQASAWNPCRVSEQSFGRLEAKHRQC